MLERLYESLGEDITGYIDGKILEMVDDVESYKKRELFVDLEFDRDIIKDKMYALKKYLNTLSQDVVILDSEYVIGTMIVRINFVDMV